MLNRAELIGHLAGPPEAGEERGKPVTYIRLLTNYRGGPPVGHDVVVTGKRGTVALERLTTGDRIHVQGRLRYRKVWDEDEERFYKRAEVVAMGDVLFLSPPRGGRPSGVADRQLEEPMPTDEELGIPPGEADFDEKDNLDDWEPNV
jgi:single-stranded DNA-binding protein